MKYIDFKRYKFSTVFKNINFKKYNFYKINKYFDLKSYKFGKYFYLKSYNFSKINKYLDLRNFNFNKYIKFRRFNFSKISKLFNLKIYKNFIFYILGFSIISSLIILNIPLFYKYEKNRIESIICKDFNLQCSIDGEIKYSFFPSPRLIVKKLVINKLNNKKNELGLVNRVETAISITSLLNKQGFIYKKIKFHDAIFNLNLEEINQYKNLVKKRFNSIPISFINSRIDFYENKNYISSIQDIKFKIKSNLNMSAGTLKGLLLEDDLYMNFKSDTIENDTKTILTIKLLESKLFTKISVNSSKLKNIYPNGSLLFKKDKNTFKAKFDYKNNKITIKQANIRNNFFNGKVDGVIKFLPYFDFDLNINLDDLNFNKFYTFIDNLSDANKTNLFKTNEKVNGKLNISADKIFSKNTLINSLESRLKFFNGDIFIEQLLLNIRKLGAADISGTIKNEKNFTNFIFDSNIFVDNLKRFHNKFGVFNKEKKPYSLFISGKLNLTNLNLTLNEISDDNKFNGDDVTYFEKEFNNLVLDDGYSGLLSFKNLKNFIKSVSVETN